MPADSLGAMVMRDKNGNFPTDMTEQHFGQLETMLNKELEELFEDMKKVDFLVKNGKGKPEFHQKQFKKIQERMMQIEKDLADAQEAFELAEDAREAERESEEEEATSSVDQGPKFVAAKQGSERTLRQGSERMLRQGSMQTMNLMSELAASFKITVKESRSEEEEESKVRSVDDATIDSGADTSRQETAIPTSLPPLPVVGESGESVEEVREAKEDDHGGTNNDSGAMPVNDKDLMSWIVRTAASNKEVQDEMPANGADEDDENRLIEEEARQAGLDKLDPVSKRQEPIVELLVQIPITGTGTPDKDQTKTPDTHEEQKASVPTYVHPKSRAPTLQQNLSQRALAFFGRVSSSKKDLTSTAQPNSTTTQPTKNRNNPAPAQRQESFTGRALAMFKRTASGRQISTPEPTLSLGSQPSPLTDAFSPASQPPPLKLSLSSRALSMLKGKTFDVMPTPEVDILGVTGSNSKSDVSPSPAPSESFDTLKKRGFRNPLLNAKSPSNTTKAIVAPPALPNILSEPPQLPKEASPRNQLNEPPPLPIELSHMELPPRQSYGERVKTPQFGRRSLEYSDAHRGELGMLGEGGLAKDSLAGVSRSKTPVSPTVSSPLKSPESPIKQTPQYGRRASPEETSAISPYMGGRRSRNFNGSEAMANAIALGEAPAVPKSPVWDTTGRNESRATLQGQHVLQRTPSISLLKPLPGKHHTAVAGRRASQEQTPQQTSSALNSLGDYLK